MPQGNELLRRSRTYTYQAAELQSWASTFAFRRTMSGVFYVASEPRLPAYGGLPTLVMAAPLETTTNPQGMLTADVSMEGMWAAMAQVEVGETGYAYIVDLVQAGS